MRLPLVLESGHFVKVYHRIFILAQGFQYSFPRFLSIFPSPLHHQEANTIYILKIRVKRKGRAITAATAAKRLPKQLSQSTITRFCM